MSKVDFFIIGAAKSGTTSFHDYLNQHPEIEMSSIKEPNFFSNEQILEDNLYYIGAPLIMNYEEYSRLYKTKKKLKGESSVSYLFYSKTAKKIYQYNRDAKLLIFLRNPIDRAFSHYLMDHSSGYVKENFSAIINNKELNHVAYQQFIEYSFYAKQINKYLEIFPREQLKIVILEDATQNLELALEQIENFLEVENFKNYNFEIKNSFSSTNNPLLRVIYNSPRAKHLIKQLIPRKEINKIKSKFLTAPKPAIGPAERSRLANLYQHDIEKLSALCHKDLKETWKL